MERPYVGITGFMSDAEVVKVLDAMPDMGHALMVGVLVSEKTLNGLPNKHPNRYPRIGDIRGIFTDDPRVLNLVHYHTKSCAGLERQLDLLVELGGPSVHGIQLNMADPPLDQLRAFKARHPGLKLVVQANHHMFRSAEYSPQRLAKTALGYAEVAEYLLFDLSGGSGMLCNCDLLCNFVCTMKRSAVPLRLGIAGGLGVYTLHTIKQLLRQNPDLSIDAESRLRTEDDRLDIGLAVEYIQRAARIFGQD